MNLKKNFLYWSLILVIVAAALPLGAAAAEQQTTVQVNGLLVYAQPDSNSQLIAVLSLGTPITILDTPPQNGFTNIRIPDGRTGWARLDVAGVPKGGATGGGTTVTSPSGLIVVAEGNVRIRTEPSLGGDQIGLIGWGETAALLGEDPSGQWYKINYLGIEGWAFAAWFRVEGGTTTTIPSPGGATDTTTGLPQVTGNPYIVQTFDNVRIRRAPSITAPRSGNIGWGETAILLAISNDSTYNWILIDYQGLIGWASGNFFKIVGGNPATLVIYEDGRYTTVTNTATPEVLSVSDAAPTSPSVAGSPTPTGPTATPQPGPTMTPVPGGQGGMVVNRTGVFVRAVGNVRVRDFPSLQGARMGFLAWGTVVELLGFSPDGEWILILTEDGDIGWSSVAWFETFSGDPSSVPVIIP